MKTTPMAALLWLWAGVASVAAQTASERDKLQDRIKVLLDKEKSSEILDYADARERAAAFKKLNEDLATFEKALAKKDKKERDALKLDGTKVTQIATRAKAWTSDATWPLMDTPANSAYREWLTKEKIRGQRILVRKSTTWRWRILVAKNERSESTMKSWLKGLAGDLTPAEWKLAYPGADQDKAKKDGKLPDWEIHHIVPLYAGDANGGRDHASNYVLLKSSDHKGTHGSGGDTYKKWGPPRLYCTRGTEFDDIDDTGDD